MVFDLGEVLSNPPAHLDRLAEVLGAEPTAATAAYWRHRQASDAGLDALAYWRLVGDEVGVDVDEALAERLTELDAGSWTSLHPESVPLLEDVKAGGYGLGLLSNLSHELAARVRRWPWASLFDVLVFSAEVGAAKPNPIIYQVVSSAITSQDGEGARPIAFFDDKQVNVDGGLAAGWKAHLWAGHDDARRFLSEVGLPL